MTSDIVLKKLDEVYFHLTAPANVLLEIRDRFRFRVPGYQFHPMYREHMWDGYIRLFNPQTRKMYAGLASRLLKFAEERNYSVDREDDFFSGLLISPIDTKEFGESLKLPVVPRTYQLFATHYAITMKRSLLLCPTGSGKSLIIYMVLRYLQENYFGLSKALIVVPTTSLVHQLYGDFEEYSALDSSWNCSKEVHKIYSGQDKKVQGTHTSISTWQSLARQPASFLNQYGILFADEAHRFTAKSLTKIATRLTNAAFRIGTTGTISESKTHEMVLEGLLGPVKQIVTSKRLMKDDHLANIKIEAVVLNYTPQEKKALARKKYQKEIDFLCAHARRCARVARIGDAQRGNTLILFQYIEKHGNLIRDELCGLLGETEYEHRVYYLHGEVDAKERDRVRAIVEEQNDAIILASYGVFSTGINIKNLHNIVFAHPGKSKIRVMQSIGRGLRTAENKTHMTLYDLVDDLKHKEWSNYTMRHFQSRYEYYVAEDFPVRITSIEV